MSEPEDNPSLIQEAEIVSAFEVAETSSSTIKPYDSETARLIEQTVNLSSGNIYCEPTCPVCTSPCREEVEQCLLEHKDYKRGIDLFQQRTGKDVSRPILENHLKNHASRGIKEVHKAEFVKKINRMAGKNLSTLSQIEFMCNFLINQAVEIGSLSPNGTDSVLAVEKVKSQEGAKLMTALNNVLKLRAQIMGEMKSSGELVTIPTDAFKRIFQDAILSAKTDGERDLIRNILLKLNSVSTE